jgi:hypothetical protein
VEITVVPRHGRWNPGEVSPRSFDHWRCRRGRTYLDSNNLTRWSGPECWEVVWIESALAVPVLDLHEVRLRVLVVYEAG